MVKRLPALSTAFKVSVLPLPFPFCQVCAAPSVTLQLITSRAVEDISMPTPEIPLSVRVLPVLMKTLPPGLVILICPKLRFPPNDTVLLDVTVLSQRAMSLLVGTTPPTQLEVKFRLLVLFAFV